MGKKAATKPSGSKAAAKQQKPTEPNSEKAQAFIAGANLLIGKWKSKG